MERTVNVAACQLTPTLGDKRANLDKALHYVEQAAKQGVHIICFPELFYTGYGLSREELLALSEPQDGPLFRELGKIARAHGMHIIMSYPERTDVEGVLYFSLMTVDETGALIGNHRKTFLWKEEKQVAHCGSAYEVVPTKYGKLATLICYEMEFPEISRLMAIKGAEIFFFPSAFMGVDLMSRHLVANALQNLVHVVGVNTVGRGKNGFSQIVDQLGNIIVSAPRDKEALIAAELCLDTEVRGEFPHWHDIHAGLFRQCLVQAEKVLM